MEYKTFQHQDQTNSEVLHAQEYTHMNDIAYHVCADFFFFKSTYRPSQFLGQKGKQTFYFFRPYCISYCYFIFQHTSYFCESTQDYSNVTISLKLSSWS